MPQKKPKPTTISQYIQAAPKETQKKLREMYATIHKAAPQAQEGLKWGMPAFSAKRILVTFAAFKHHIGFYPTPSAVKAFAKDLSKFHTAKGSIQFPLDKPLPLALIKKITVFRVKENEEKDVKWKTTKPEVNRSYIHYHNDGSIWAKGKMVGKKMNGYWEWFRKNGTKIRSGYFNKGRQVGIWTTYDQKGRVYKVTSFGIKPTLKKSSKKS